MIKKIEELELEKKVRIYRKCIEAILSKHYVRGTSVIIDGIMFSFDNLLDVCYYVVPVYGSVLEQKKFYNCYGLSNCVIEDDIVNSIRLDRMKYIYNYRENNCLDREKLKKLAKKMKVKISDVSVIAKEYAVSYLKYDVMDYNWHIFCKKRGNIKAKMSYCMLFDILLKLDNKDDVVYIIDYSNVDIYNYSVNKIKHYISKYCNNKTEQEKKEMFDNLEEKVNYYIMFKENRDNQEKEDRKNEVKSFARNFLEGYVNSTKSYKYMMDYCRELGVRKGLVGDMMNILRDSELEADKKLYDMCIKKIEIDKYLGSSDVNYIAGLLSDYILNGVPTDKGVRDFDLIDFYTLTNLSSKEIAIACQNILEKNDYVKVKKFLSVSEKLKMTLMNSKKAVDLDIEFNCQKDKAGFPIVGTGRKLTEDERREILDLFDKYNIPLYLFKIAVDRIKKGIRINDLVIDIKPLDRKSNKVLKRL